MFKLSLSKVIMYGIDEDGGGDGSGFADGDTMTMMMVIR
jgi:hypothetical protein